MADVEERGTLMHIHKPTGIQESTSWWISVECQSKQPTGIQKGH